MFTNYIKIALRNLKKTKLFSLINILGLAIGMTACLLILHYVNFERSYDTFHEQNHRIYRLRHERTGEDGNPVRFASCCPPAAPLVREKYPEVEKIARIFRYRAGVSFDDNYFHEDRMFFAEPDFLDILKFKFIHGDPLTGIRAPNTAFISLSTAKKYFGDFNPVGKTIYVDKKNDYMVTGVFEDIPQNSHLKFDILLSWKNAEALLGPEVLQAWGHTGFYTYIRFKPGTDPLVFEKKLEPLVDEHFGEVLKKFKMTLRLVLQPLTGIHLTSHVMQEYELNGNRDSVNFLLIIALFIMVIAWVNYINLSTARAMDRAKEVALRKVVGGTRGQLMAQFFFETILLNGAAIFIALGLVEFTLPLFSQVTGTPSSYSIWRESWFRAVLPGLFMVGVFLSGFYPVAVMSSFKPAAVLKGKLGTSAGGIKLRKTLVVFQFVMALVLIAGTFSIYRQIEFMRSQKLGFNLEQTLVVRAPRVRDESFKKKIVTFKETLLTDADVNKFCVATEVPGRQILWDAGAIHKEGDSSTKGKNYQIVGIDYDFVDFFDLEILYGRNFSKEFPSDDKALILNETAVKWMGFKGAEAAVGNRVNYWGKIYPIVGVMKDYHQQSLKKAFEPHIFWLLPYGRGNRGVFAVKINPGNVPETVGRVRRQYEAFFPGNPFDSFFLDEYYDQQYNADELFGKVIGIFSFLAVFVTGLGIFGLSSFMSVQRTKEIGIRKVLGANVSQILLLLTKDFLVLIIISFIFALPFTYLGINEWLNSFAHRMNLNPVLFLLPLASVLLITLITIGSHVVKAALKNPITSIKHE